MQIVWFRKDLRIHDNPALTLACQNGPVTAVYFVTPLQWQQHDVAPIQIDFIEKSINQLAYSLATLGIELIVETVDLFDDIPDALATLCKKLNASQVFANSEVEVDEINRDIKVQQQGIDLQIFQADCILNPGQVLTQQGTMFKVFTPFKINWLKQVQALDLSPYCKPAAQNAASEIIIPTAFTIDRPKKDSAYWLASEDAAQTHLVDFLDQFVEYYHLKRDFPAKQATSMLSPYLALGLISTKQCLHALLLRFPDALDNAKNGVSTWVNELVWREFYRHIMVLNPNLGKGDNYNKLGNQIQWQNDPKLFKAWCEGKTGYPLVDAAMQQLIQTGWMHNRLRMVCASFLTKHLLIDWRWGERFFKQHLIDGDLASNNGGWQWAASTGCDAQPYFRIFNPIIQSQKFDPNGQFISIYNQALAHLSDKQIHFPVNPIVEHKVARLTALQLFSVLKKG
ncbi:deoxyribodipyrimidine photo-lyase [Psychromonas sp. Urea-02u-13]|uniref:deoxyribodipyrimidine photo-lyase n=1 Tax=Psychromonas sp. Urea-02u-13 TaxID=2058326 RepID=UPI000C33E2D0|nr:deoxyribodipyrimidine photo-lyase [Psychromonas sp. Urea-02u-13]PKG38475.1 deoxyribodipyrimidine photo-lyase [Psychromonas sp. Urea-02u-13]